MHDVTRRAMELWGPIRTSNVGNAQDAYQIRATLYREFPTTPRKTVFNCAMQAIRMVKQSRKQ